MEWLAVGRSGGRAVWRAAGRSGGRCWVGRLGVCGVVGRWCGRAVERAVGCLGVFVLCCVVRTRNDIARRRPTTKKKGEERWALILVLPRHFGRVVKASAC